MEFHSGLPEFYSGFAELCLQQRFVAMFPKCSVTFEDVCSMCVRVCMYVNMCICVEGGLKIGRRQCRGGGFK